MDNQEEDRIPMTTKSAAILTLAIILASNAFAQDLQGAIRGAVKDELGQELFGVNVLVQGTTIGAVSDVDGEFTIERVPPGAYEVRFSLLGYMTKIVGGVAVAGGRTSRIEVVLEEEAIELTAVQIVGERSRQGMDDVRTSLKFLQPQTVRAVAGLGEDIIRGLQSLPGVVAPNDFTAQFAVRGSGPDQNLIVMDDIEIFNPYRLYGAISMFNPETVSDVSLITGGFPARYGDRLSAVLDVTNKQGSRDTPIRTSINASVSNANIVLEGRLPLDVPGSYVLSARRTYYDLIVGPIAQRSGLVGADVAFPNFSDVQTKLTFGPFDGSRFILNGMRSRDGVDLVSGDKRSAPDSVDWLNETYHAVAGFAWHYAPTKHYFGKTGISYYRNDGATNFAGTFLDPSLNREQFDEDAWRGNAGLRFVSVLAKTNYIFEKVSAFHESNLRSGNHLLDAGVGVDVLRSRLRWDVEIDPILRAINQSRGVSNISQVEQENRYYRAHAFIQDRIHASTRLWIQPGIRVDYYSIIEEFTLAPRVNVGFALDAATTLRGAVGLFYQSPGYEKFTDEQQQRNFLDLSIGRENGLRPERSLHVVAGMDRWLDQDIQLTVDAYYKRFDDLIIAQVVPGTRYETSQISGSDPRVSASWTAPTLAQVDSVTNVPINGADGNAYGVEVFLERRRLESTTRLSGWISYALSWANRTERGKTIPFEFDQRHTINVVGNYRWLDWLEVGVNWRYGSNFPFTPAVGIRPRILVDAQGGVAVPRVQTDDRGQVIFDIDRGVLTNRNAGRKPAYHRLDMRVTAYTAFWGADWTFYLDVINVYNRANILNYGYFVSDDLTVGVRETNMFPILPTLGMSVRF